MFTACIVLLVALVAVPPADGSESAHAMYTRALARERQLRDAANRPTLAQLRAAIAAYEAIVRRYPRSGYSDNALWQGGNLALLAYERYGQAADKTRAQRLLTSLRTQYPSSSLVPRVAEVLKQLEVPRAAAVTPPAAVKAAPKPSPKPSPPAPPPSQPLIAEAPSSRRDPVLPEPGADDPSGADVPERDATPTDESGLVTIRNIRRTAIPDGVRVSIEMDGEAHYRSERLENPRRVFFDLKNTRTIISLQDATIAFDDELVREVRLGRHPQNTTRIVMELQDADRFSVFTLYNPFRLVVDFRRAGAEARSAGPTWSGPPTPAAQPVPPVVRQNLPNLPSPTPPAANTNGQFSIARQLGLGVSRIVLDAGHGGHDPGARANGISEAELVLDVTLRLRDLLEKQPGFEVTLTRDKDVFVPLEERTAIANREGADLFLSIHANASRNASARGVETYFLNFATNREAEAVAARENSASGRSMHSLPDIVRAIALNNKIDESRDFAAMVQQSMVKRLSGRYQEVRDLGVKQAPFVVLIGASMPSVLAEISFVTHRQEAARLKTSAYRQQIAEALLEAILRYQRSLKGVRAVAALE